MQLELEIVDATIGYQPYTECRDMQISPGELCAWDLSTDNWTNAVQLFSALGEKIYCVCTALAKTLTYRCQFDVVGADSLLLFFFLRIMNGYWRLLTDFTISITVTCWSAILPNSFKHKALPTICQHPSPALSSQPVGGEIQPKPATMSYRSVRPVSRSRFSLVSRSVSCGPKTSHQIRLKLSVDRAKLQTWESVETKSYWKFNTHGGISVRRLCRDFLRWLLRLALSW